MLSHLPSKDIPLMQLSERDTRRNIAALGVDYVTFILGTAFLSPTTILPAFLRLLGAGPVVVGSLGTIHTGLWLLPQLLAGRYLANRPLVKRYVVVPAAISRLSLLLLAPVLWWSAARAPGLAVAAILLAYTVFVVLDALSAVGWFELLNKVLPPARRGRLLGAAQSLSNLLALGAGALVSLILARPGPLWANHTLLVLLAGLCFIVGPWFLATIREPHGVVQSARPLGWGHYLPRLRGILRHDRRFAWVIAVRWLSGLADMAGAFYILFATERLRMPEEMIGLFVAAGVAGGLLCGALLGPLGDRKGSDRVIVVLMLLRCLAPALTLVSPLVAAQDPGLAVGLFALIFAIIGMATQGNMVGFSNYLLSIAPPGETSSYIALANTLSGLLTAAPLVAGWLVQALSYEFVFALTLGLAALGLALALRGPRVALAAAAPSR